MNVSERKNHLEITAQLSFKDDLPLCVTAIPHDAYRPGSFRNEQCTLHFPQKVSGLNFELCVCFPPPRHQHRETAWKGLDLQPIRKSCAVARAQPATSQGCSSTFSISKITLQPEQGQTSFGFSRPVREPRPEVHIVWLYNFQSSIYTDWKNMYHFSSTLSLWKYSPHSTDRPVTLLDTLPTSQFAAEFPSQLTDPTALSHSDSVCEASTTGLHNGS